MAHTAHRPGRLIFGSDTWTGLAKLGKAGIPIILILQMQKLRLRETSHVTSWPQITKLHHFGLHSLFSTKQ